MAFEYHTPGVTVKEYTESSIGALLALPDSICLVGPASGYIGASKSITLNGILPVEILPSTSDDGSASGSLTSNPIISLYDQDPTKADTEYDSSVGYQNGSYTLSTVNRTIARKSVNSVPGLSITTTAGSTAATLNATTGLATASTYTISSSTIPSLNDITFTTGGTLSTAVTLSSSSNVTSGTAVPAAINKRITVTTTAGSTSANLSGVSGLAVNTTYTIYTVNGNIPEASGITFTTGSSLPSDPWAITLSSGTGVLAGTSSAVILNPVNTGLTVTTTANSTSATLSGVTGLEANTTYFISTSSTIPSANKITFTTPATPVVGITLSSSTGVTTGTTQAATITAPLIPNGESLTVNFKYTPDDYWNTKIFTDTTSIEARFGNKYNSTQTAVNSPLSLAASIAFENGATSIAIQPVFYQGTDNVKRQPTNTEIASTDYTWTKTLTALRSAENIGVIIPVVGQATNYGFADGATALLNDSTQLAILRAVQAHIAYQQDPNNYNNQWMVGIFGEDATDTTGTYAADATITTHVASLQSAYAGKYNQQTVLVSPAAFAKTTPNGNVIRLGGQYVASAIAGMLVSRSVSSSLTRKNIIGFDSVKNIKSKSAKISDSASGLFVIEQKGDNLIQVRHAITTDITSTANSELSVIRAKHRVVNSVTRTIDEQIIGNVVADNNAPYVIASAITGVLNRMVDDKEIVGFSDVQAKTLSLNPTTVEIRFSYRPAFPINLIQVGFSIDLTTGTLNVSSTNAGAING